MRGINVFTSRQESLRISTMIDDNVICHEQRDQEVTHRAERGELETTKEIGRERRTEHGQPKEAGSLNISWFE